MRLCQALRVASSIGANRATQALSSGMPQAAPAGSLATSGRQSSAPKQRQYIDYLIVGVSMIVATSALQARNKHQDEMEHLEARILRCQKDSQSMLDDAGNVRKSLLEDVDKGVAIVVQSRGADRTQNLLRWVESHLASVDTSGEIGQHTPKNPTII